MGSEDFLQDFTEFMLNRTMKADVAQCINADRHERTDGRETYRTGFRDHQFNTRLGALLLRLPKFPEVAHFPPFLEALKLSEMRSTRLFRKPG
ncbi:transposase [Aeromonas caviae]|nr:transposase [Aeromonas caviae]